MRSRLSTGAFHLATTPSTLAALSTLLARAERIRTQQPKDKNKLYALHAPEVECISKGKARIRYEFGVKVSLAVVELKLMLARSFNRASKSTIDARTLLLSAYHVAALQHIGVGLNLGLCLMNSERYEQNIASNIIAPC